MATEHEIGIPVAVNQQLFKLVKWYEEAPSNLIYLGNTFHENVYLHLFELVSDAIERFLQSQNTTLAECDYSCTFKIDNNKVVVDLEIWNDDSNPQDFVLIFNDE